MNKAYLIALISLILFFCGCEKEEIGETQDIYTDSENTAETSQESDKKEDSGFSLSEFLGLTKKSKDSSDSTDSSSGSGGGGGGGGGAGDSGDSGSSGGETSLTVCQKADADGLCDGLDLTYGEGTKSNCCIDEGVCC